MRRALVPFLAGLLVLTGFLVSPAAHAVEARSTAASCPKQATAFPQFWDVRGTSPFAAQIACMRYWQVTNGAADGSYRPATAVTRAEMATFLVRAVQRSGGTVPTTKRDYFTDDTGSAHQASLNALAAAGIMRGAGGGRVHPRHAITRVEMGALLVRVHDYRASQAGKGPLPAAGDAFRDDDGYALSREVDKAAAVGIVAGTSRTEFSPRGAVRRDQMAAFLARLFDVYVSSGIARVPASPPLATVRPPAPVASSSGGYFGWDPAGTAVPPLLRELPFHTNTGLHLAADRAALRTHNGDFTTTSNNQVIDRMNITGKLVVKHSGVTVKRSWVHARIENLSTSPVRAIHIDLGDGRPGDFVENGTKGSIHLYRSNVFGVTDAVQTTPGTDFVLQDNFIHDLRKATTSSQSSGETHNDGFQVNTRGVKAVLRHNTFFMFGIDGKAGQSATRSSGPNWSGSSPTAVTGKGGVKITSAVMVGSGGGWNPDLLIEGNLFRGHTYADLNIQSGNVRVLNNTFSTKDNVSGRGDIAGRANIDQWSGNTSMETRATIS